MHLLFIFVTVFAVSQATSENEETTLWNSFKNDHNKQYSTIEEENYRFGVFKDNVAMINKHNLEADMGLHSYRVKINQFADMTKQEFSEKMLSGLKTPSRRPRGRPFEMPSNIEIPESVDWRKKGAVIDVIEDQGQCGSCWAFTATGALEGQHFLKTKKLVRLSAQNLIDCSGSFGNYGCNGGLMDSAFQYIQANKGIDTAASYPYEAKNADCRFNRSNVGATDTGFVDLPPGNETALQIAIANIGPISVAVDASHSGFQTYSSGIYDEPLCSKTNIDHSFILVGYGTFNNGTTKQDYYIAKNSWGKSWGMDGYILMSRNKQNQCGIANIGSYPTV